MTHGTSTLREVLEQHVTSVPEHPKRLEEVHRRARSLRRRRAGVAVGALAALVVVVLAVTAGPGLLTSRQDRSVPAYQQRVGALLVWSNGSRLAAHSSFLSTARRSATFTVTPTTWSMGVAQACSHELGQKLGVFLSVNGHVVIGGGCGPGGGDFSRGSYGIEQQFWAESGVHLDEPMTVRFWVAAMTKAPFRRG
ncbi:MAG: hypothetical protein QOJ83_3002, partial [Frankiales bacterium]|nr:hypothetical protein [Frankiales bacterium]